MKRYLLKGVMVVLVMVTVVAVAQPAMAWVRVGINVRVPFPIVIAPVAAVGPARVVYGPPVPVAYRPIWIPGHYNRFGTWVPGHWR